MRIVARLSRVRLCAGGQAVVLEDHQGGGPVQLVIQGLSGAGFLLAEDGLGAKYELTPDGNSLDMMQGLIRRKLPA
jgi:biotin--protein ligase